MGDRSVPTGTDPVSFMPPEESEPGSKSNLKGKKMKAVLLLKANSLQIPGNIAVV